MEQVQVLKAEPLHEVIFYVPWSNDRVIYVNNEITINNKSSTEKLNK